MTRATVADLAVSKLLGTLAPDELQRAAALFDVRRLPKGAIVACEGQRLDLFNIVLSGRVSFFWLDEGGRQFEIAVVGPGDDFAAQSVSGEPMLTSIIALDELCLASIPLSEFEQLLLRHPRLAVDYVKRVVSLFRRSMLQRKSFTAEDVYRRVTRLLLDGAVPADGMLVLPERLTHAAIGQRVGATREMVGRVLRDLARGGYIKMERGQISILRSLPRHW